jgi:site-specific recombinase XerD
MTFQEYLQERYTEGTVKTYMYIIDDFLFFQHKEPTEINNWDVLLYFKELTVFPKTKLCAVKRFFDYLMHTNQISKHPCSSVRILTKSPPFLPQRLFTKKELETLLNRPNRYTLLEYRNKAILSFLIYQGFTSQNIINLKLKDINFDDNMVTIKKTRLVNGRTLPLISNQVTLLQTYIENERKHLNCYKLDYFFIGKTGRQYSIEALFRMVKTLNDFYPDRPLNPKTIRFSVIKDLYHIRKLPIEQVMIFSGHHWLTSIKKFALNDAAERVDDMNNFFPINKM